MFKARHHGLPVQFQQICSCRGILSRSVFCGRRAKIYFGLRSVPGFPRRNGRCALSLLGGVLVVHIDPHAWLVTVPLAIALVQAKILPQQHFAKRWLKQIAEQEGAGWEMMGVKERPFDLSDKPRARTILFAVMVAALAISSLASFVAFLFGGAAV
jgi:hypothetical protein